MSKLIKDVLPTVLALAPAERAELAAELLASLDGEPDADAEQAWAKEIEGRVQHVRSGKAKGRPWSDVYADLTRTSK